MKELKFTDSINLPVLKEIEKLLKGNIKRALIFAHDDPDGVTSCIILSRILQKLKINVFVYFSGLYEVEKNEFYQETKKVQPDLFVVLDKGTIETYDFYADNIKNVLIIDHHPLIGKPPQRCIVFNPAINKYEITSSSHLCIILSHYLNLSDDFMDLMAIIGMKADWVINPAINKTSEFCKSFYFYALKKYFNFFKKISTKALRPTMFECEQKLKTTLLNQVAELAFALTGGGFQYFYNTRDKSLKNIFQPLFTYNCFMKLSKDIKKLKKITRLDAFVDLLHHKKIVKKIWNYYLNDWKKSEVSMKNIIYCGENKNNFFYLYFGYHTPLMPMVGSVILYDLKKIHPDKEIVLLMVNYEDKNGIHFSFRSTGNQIHLGEFAQGLAENLIEKFGHRGIISGGGHPQAAECRTRTSGVSYIDAVEIFIKQLKSLI